MTKRLLVVDNQASSRSAKAAAMRRIGYHVDEATSGLDALKRFIADNYDVILMDYDMPSMSGPECALKIREYESGTSSKTFIIGVTGSGNSVIRERWLTAGMDACMNEETNSEELQKLVQERTATC